MTDEGAAWADLVARPGVHVYTGEYLVVPTEPGTRLVWLSRRRGYETATMRGTSYRAPWVAVAVAVVVEAGHPAPWAELVDALVGRLAGARAALTVAAGQAPQTDYVQMGSFRTIRRPADPADVVAENAGERQWERVDVRVKVAMVAEGTG